MAGAVLGEGQVLLFVAGAVLVIIVCEYFWQVSLKYLGKDFLVF